eukprot:8088599-Pyramimonas_sp.AAC.1
MEKRGIMWASSQSKGGRGSGFPNTVSELRIDDPLLDCQLIMTAASSICTAMMQAIRSRASQTSRPRRRVPSTSVPASASSASMASWATVPINHVPWKMLSALGVQPMGQPDTAVPTLAKNLPTERLHWTRCRSQACN